VSKSTPFAFFICSSLTQGTEFQPSSGRSRRQAVLSRYFPPYGFRFDIRNATNIQWAGFVFPRKVNTVIAGTISQRPILKLVDDACVSHATTSLGFFCFSLVGKQKTGESPATD